VVPEGDAHGIEWVQRMKWHGAALLS